MFKITEIKPIDKNHWQKVQQRFDNLIKPVGSLARLEYITCLYASAGNIIDIVYPQKELIVFGEDEALISHLQAMDESVCIKMVLLQDKDYLAAFEMGKKSVVMADKAKVMGLSFWSSKDCDAQKALAIAEQGDIIELAKMKNTNGLFALAGAILQAASFNMPVFLDNDITLLAAYIASSLNPLVKEYLIAVSTTSSNIEGVLLDKLGLFTMLDLQLQNPSGESAILGFSLLNAGIKSLCEMDSFGNETVHGPLGDIKKKD